MDFKVGERVAWTTPRARGRGFMRHSGVVVEVVLAGEVPHVTWLAAPRDHKSYLVQEGKEIFWPRVKWFVKGEEN